MEKLQDLLNQQNQLTKNRILQYKLEHAYNHIRKLKMLKRTPKELTQVKKRQMGTETEPIDKVNIKEIRKINKEIEKAIQECFGECP